MGTSLITHAFASTYSIMRTVATGMYLYVMDDVSDQALMQIGYVFPQACCFTFMFSFLPSAFHWKVYVRKSEQIVSEATFYLNPQVFYGFPPLYRSVDVRVSCFQLGFDVARSIKKIKVDQKRLSKAETECIYCDRALWFQRVGPVRARCQWCYCSKTNWGRSFLIRFLDG